MFIKSYYMLVGITQGDAVKETLQCRGCCVRKDAKNASKASKWCLINEHMQWMLIATAF